MLLQAQLKALLRRARAAPSGTTSVTPSGRGGSSRRSRTSSSSTATGTPGCRRSRPRAARTRTSRSGGCRTRRSGRRAPPRSTRTP
ncbi:hypothetical protein ACFQV4_35870 [Streptomyces thermocarboxydus]